MVLDSNFKNLHHSQSIFFFFVGIFIAFYKITQIMGAECGHINK